MWRDINMFNEVGIAAVTYGPRAQRHSFRKAITIEALYQAACVYARTMVDICSQEKPHAANSKCVGSSSSRDPTLSGAGSCWVSQALDPTYRPFAIRRKGKQQACV